MNKEESSLEQSYKGIIVRLLALCSVWIIVDFAFVLLDSHIQIEEIWAKKMVYAAAQYIITCAVMRRILKLTLPQRRFDRELYGIIIFFSVGFFLIAIYRTTREMPLYVGEITGYILEEFFLIALLEEIVFRGMVSQVLGETKSEIKVIFSTLIFTLMHYISWMPAIFDFEFYQIGISLLSPFILGALLATLFEIRKDIGLTVMVHGTYNVLTLVSYGNVRVAICLCYILFVIAYCIYCKRKGKREGNEKNYGFYVDAGIDGE